jgi:hypothetical protein
MGALARRRPLFHSEADFQLALAWEIQTAHPDAEIRMERRLLANPTVALDVLVRLDGLRLGIELKYLKADLALELDGEPFVLRPGAPDVERYDVLKDVMRLERLRHEELIDAGCALVLSNEPAFWRSPTRAAATAFDAFRLHDGQRLTGRLEWGASAGPGTRRLREAPIALHGSYPLRWRPYAQLDAARNDELRYLAIVVDRLDAGASAPQAAASTADASDAPPRNSSAPERAEPPPSPPMVTDPRDVQASDPPAGHGSKAAEDREWSRLTRSEVREHGLSLIERELGRVGFRVRAETGQRRNVLHAEREGRRLEVHVRTVRNLNYAFWPKARFQPRADPYAGLVRLPDDAPAELYLIPSLAWHSPDALLVAPDYQGLASAPEWGVRLTHRNLPLLARFAAEAALAAISD